MIGIKSKKALIPFLLASVTWNFSCNSLLKKFESPFTTKGKFHKVNIPV